MGEIVREMSTPVFAGLIDSGGSFSHMEHDTYSMKFNWSTSTNADGEDILKVSYVSRDKQVWSFPGTFRYIITDKILKISGNGSLDFNKKE